MKIKAFIFDLDGVIMNTTNLHYKAWCNELSKLNINYAKEDNERLKGLSRLTTLKAILKLENRLSEFSEVQLIQISNAKNDFYKQLIKSEISENDILPGIQKFLKQAKQNNIKLAIASSSRNAKFLLEQVGLRTTFDYIVDHKSIKKGKPAPDIFIAACTGVGADVTEVIGFEDAIEGVKGLVAAKIKTVAITWGVKANWSDVTLKLRTTSELDFNQIINL